MTLVLAILASLAGVFVSAQISYMTEKKREFTLLRMKEIQAQVTWFRQVNHRLPCPATATLTIADADYGKEERSGNCATADAGYPGTVQVADGSVPTKSLALSDDYMYDGWGRRFRFVVAQEFTRDCAFTNHPITEEGYSGLTILDAAGATTTSQAIYAVVSHGINGHGAYLQSGSRLSADSTNTDELENCDCTAAAAAGTLDGELVDAPFKEVSGAPTNRFDDVVRYYAREEVLSQNDLDGTTETCP